FDVLLPGRRLAVVGDVAGLGVQRVQPTAGVGAEPDGVVLADSYRPHPLTFRGRAEVLHLGRARHVAVEVADVGGGEVDRAVDGGLPEGALAAVAVRDSGLQHVLVGAQVHDGELRGRGRIARHDVAAERFAGGACPDGGAQRLGLVARFTEIRDRAVGAWSVGFDGGL